MNPTRGNNSPAWYSTFATTLVISDWHSATHPHPFAFGGCDLVPYSLARHFPFELGEGEQNIQGQPPHRSCGVELLSDRYEGDSARVQSLYDPGKIGQATGEAIDFIDNDGIDFAIFNVFQQSLKCGPFHGSAGISPVVVVTQ
jgi:putative component of membrane protein insertase Oxa1/YidC/SpoIIIJ protein YidD